MLYFKFNETLEVVAVSSSHPDEISTLDPHEAWAPKSDATLGAGWLNRTDFEHPGFDGPAAAAEKIAASAAKLTGKAYLAVDRGDGVWPRYDVIEAPAVGDEVSKGFNGDYYPVGKIVRVGKGYKQIRVDGPRGQLTFYRRGNTGSWVQAGGTWSLIPGVHNEINPHF